MARSIMVHYGLIGGQLCPFRRLIRENSLIIVGGPLIYRRNPVIVTRLCVWSVTVHSTDVVGLWVSV